MSLHEMMDAQELLQIEAYGGVSPRDLSGEEQIEFIRWNILALEDELHEALAETGWKPWATSKHVNVDAFKGELVDVMHFFMNLCTTVGMDADELEERYFAKRAKNVKRQAEGYDGVGTKCPMCKRALDDDAVTCRRKNAKYFTCAQHGTFINYSTQPELPFDDIKETK